jgi:pimeloyl-ACP methyl ester carboxylesterase
MGADCNLRPMEPDPSPVEPGPRPGARVTANGLDVGYDVHGAGPPMILLHGATSSGREDYAAQIPLFSKAFRLYLPDARGHATTRWDPAEGLHTDDLVADVAAFADALHLSTFHLVGFSMGAATALLFAIRHPDRLRTLVVIGTSLDREPRTSVARRILDPDRIERNDPRWAAELERRHGPIQGTGAWRQLLEAVVADVVEQGSIDLADLRNIQLPAMVVAGDRDPFTPVGQAWNLQRQLPDARLLIVPGAGHQVTAHRPGIVNEAMASFYRSTEAEARRRSVGPATAGLTASQEPSRDPDDQVMTDGALDHHDEDDDA